MSLEEQFKEYYVGLTQNLSIEEIAVEFASQSLQHALVEVQRKIEDKVDLLQGNRLQNASDMSEVDGLHTALNYIQEIKTKYSPITE